MTLQYRNRTRFVKRRVPDRSDEGIGVLRPAVQLVISLTKTEHGMARERAIGVRFVLLLPGKTRELRRVLPCLVSVKRSFPA